MIVIGVDPGKSGAIAFLFDGADPEVKPMPVIPGGKGSRVEYDLPAIRDSLFIFKNTGTIAYIEKAQPLPKSFGGGIANFERGRCTGWAWMLTALGIPFHSCPRGHGRRSCSPEHRVRIRSSDRYLRHNDYSQMCRCSGRSGARSRTMDYLTHF